MEQENTQLSPQDFQSRMQGFQRLSGSFSGQKPDNPFLGVLEYLSSVFRAEQPTPGMDRTVEGPKRTASVSMGVSMNGPSPGM